MVNLKERIENALADLVGSPGYTSLPGWMIPDLARKLAESLAADFGGLASCDSCGNPLQGQYCDECRAMIAESGIKF